jgi:GTP-binding protein
MPLKLAIVGRPNVGKSTLFNRLAGRRLAIVDDRPGVTRDRREATGRLGDLDLDLIDTAGFEDVDDESLEARMRKQTERAVEDAAVVLFVIDAREGVVPLDRIFADLVRRSGKAVVLAANKAEGNAGESGIAESYRLGLGDPIAISAEHGEGMSELYEALIMASGDAMFEEEPAADRDNPVKIAIVGRPNAGKSTLVNRLIGEDRLLVGPEAGITRDAISLDWEWDGRRVRLVDTAGLRKKARVNETLEKLSTGDTIRAITFAEVVILVMDAENAFETQDLQIADLVEREGRALVFCIAKWDLVADPQARLAELRETAERMLPQVRGTPLIALSAETGRGVDKLMPAVVGVHANWATKIKTRDLNDWLAMAVQRHPPPAVQGRRIKPKYMAQTKARPPTFVLFASRADALPEQYRRYLINSLRESFDFPGVPIRISIKANKNPYADEADGNRSTPEKRWPTKTKAPAAPKPAAKEGASASAPAPARPTPRPKAKPKPGKSTPSFKVKAPGKATIAKKPKTGWQRPVPKLPTTHKLRKPKGPGKRSPRG